MPQDLGLLKEKITRAGFRPAPLAFVLHMVRRLMWPIIRQYHFFQLEVLLESVSEADAKIREERRRLDELSLNHQLLYRDVHRLGETSTSEYKRLQLHTDEQAGRVQDEIRSNAQRVQEWLAETQKLIPILVSLRSDAAALANRQSLLADDFQTFKSHIQLQVGEIAKSLTYGSPLEIANLQERLSFGLSRIESLQAEQDRRQEFQFNALHEEQLRILDETRSELNAQTTAFQKIRQEIVAARRDVADLSADVDSRRQENATRVEAVMSRLYDYCQEAVYRATLPVAETRAEIAVIQKRMVASDALSSKIGASLQDVESHSAAIEALSARQAEILADFQEVEWRSRFYIRETNGGLFILKRGELISDHVASGKMWDPHIVEVAHEVAGERLGTAVDVGGHFGLLSAALARRFERVVAFEPNDFAYSFFTANMALNGLKNVECHSTPLFSRECEMSLARSEMQETSVPVQGDGVFDGLSATNVGALVFAENGMGIFQHKARTLDSYELENVSFIKIDAQGADGEVLFGSIETLRRCRPVIIFEWETFLARNFSRGFEEVEGMLKQLGYSVNLLHRSTDKQVDYIARCL